MKNVLAGLVVIMSVFPTTLTKHAQEVNSRADKAMTEIAPLAIQASAKGRHYVYYSVKPWSSDVAKEIGYRLNKLEGIWSDGEVTSGPVFIHFQ